jgi:hypothetical protein
MFGWMKKTLKQEPPMQVGDVLSAYGALMEKHPLAIMDISMLPIPKTKMKVLLKSLYTTANNPAQRNLFEAGFIHLSKFQDGVGHTPIDCHFPRGDIKANSQADIEAMNKWLLLEKLSLADSEVLLAEWKRFLGGEPIYTLFTSQSENPLG